MGHHIAEDFGHLDAIFDSTAAVPTLTPGSPVTLFTGTDGVAALYIDGVLVASGEPEGLLTQALVHLGAHVFTSSEHLLGHIDGEPAPSLEAVSEYVEAVERIDSLRVEAADLRSQADDLENGLI